MGVRKGVRKGGSYVGKEEDKRRDSSREVWELGRRVAEKGNVR